MTRKLTKKEEKAIQALQALAKIWPETLMLFSWSGDLTVIDIKNREEWFDKHPEKGYREYMDGHNLQPDGLSSIINDGGCP